MSRGYGVTLPTVNNAVGGDPSTGTKWNESWVDQEADAINDVLSDVDTDVSFLYAQVGADTPDNVSYKYKDSSTVTVSAGIAGDWTISSETDVDFTGASADTYYYLWVGEDSVSGLTAIKKGTSPSTPPAGLVSATAHRLRWYVLTDGSGNVDPFWFPFGDDIDTVLYEPDSGDATKFNILPGGEFTAHDGSLYRVEEEISLDINTDWTADNSLTASTFAYIWGGEDSSGDLLFVPSHDADELPSELVKGRRLRWGIYIDGSSNIQSFYIQGDWYWFDSDAEVAGSDAFEVYDATLTSTFTSLDCSAFIPEGARKVHLLLYEAANGALYCRPSGSNISTGILVWNTPNNGEKILLSLPLSATGTIDIRYNASVTVRITVLGFTS
jgi:hypothetical protein